MTVLSLAAKSLRNRAFTSALTVGSIALSVALLVGVERIRQQSQASFASTISGTDLIVGARASPVQLLLYSVFRIGNPTNNIRWESYRHVAALPQVAWSVPIALGDSHRGYRVMGTTRAYLEHFRYAGARRLELAEGVWFHEDSDVVLGAEVARALGYGLGREVVVAHGGGDVSFVEHSDKPFRVSGILAPTGTPVDRTLHVSLRGLDRLHEDMHAAGDAHAHDPLLGRLSAPAPGASPGAAAVHGHEQGRRDGGAHARGHGGGAHGEAQPGGHDAGAATAAGDVLRGEGATHDHGHRGEAPAGGQHERHDDRASGSGHDAGDGDGHDHGGAATHVDAPGTGEAHAHGTGEAHAHGAGEADAHGTGGAHAHGAGEADAHGAGGAHARGAGEAHAHGAGEAHAHGAGEADGHAGGAHAHGAGEADAHAHGAGKAHAHGEPASTGAVSAVLVGLHSRPAAVFLQREIAQYEEEPLTAILPGLAMQELWGVVGVLERTLLAVSALVVVVGLSGMLIALTTSLDERRREMAVLRSVGARPAHVLGLVVGEAGFLTAIAVVLGVALVYGLMAFARPVLQAEFGLYVDPGWPGAVEWALIALVGVVGVLVGLIPGYRVYRYSLADGMTIRT